ncbi:MAG: NAD+ synthase [Bdellovibrio sp.]
MKKKSSFRKLKIAVAQINPILGDFERNCQIVLENAQRASQEKADLIVFPESCLMGYAPFDLLERSETVDLQMRAFQRLIKRWPSGVVGLLGVLTPRKTKKGRPYFNSAAWIEKGKLPRFFHKQLLPTGDVFDEARFIEAGSMKKNLVNFKGHRILVTICEDIWAWPDKDGESPYQLNPLEDISSAAVDLILNLSASPFFPNKILRRHQLLKKTSKRFRAPMLYVNMVGAQDELIFDGGSLVTNSTGELLHVGKRFSEDFFVCDWEAQPVRIQKDSVEQLRQSLVLGIRDFVEKMGFQKVHLGLSGGIDSGLLACLAVQALGVERVKFFALPGPYSSAESWTLAKELAVALGADLESLEITSLYTSFVEKISHFLPSNKELTVSHENLQSRLRGLVLMFYANAQSSLLLSTSNKSEYATGFATLYGDMCGGLAPLGDLTKAQIYELSQLYSCIPKQMKNRAPTAELRPDQKDEDSLPPYKQLDSAVINLVEKDLPARSPVEKWLLLRLAQTEFKRWQAPPILKVSERAFGRGRRWPIVNRVFVSRSKN